MDLVARVRARCQVFCALLGPTHRALELECREWDEDVLDRLNAFLTKAAANITGDDADSLRRQPQGNRDQSAENMRRLRASPNRERIGQRVHISEDAARLQWRGHVSMGVELFLDHDR